MFFYLFTISDDIDRKNSEIPSHSFDESHLPELIESAKNGDSAAFSSLVNLFEKFVYNTACRVLSSSGHPIDSAEDIAQDSFIKAWRSVGSFRGDCTFSTWLFRITVNTSRDHIRTASRKNALSLTRYEDSEDDEYAEWDVPVTSGDEIPEDFLEKKELILAVRRAVEELPEDQRAVIVLRDLNELPYTEIAEKLGIELGTLKSRLNRGRKNLKAILETYGFF